MKSQPKNRINLLNRKITNEFRDSDHKGSQMRCLRLTEGAVSEVADALTELIGEGVVVSASDKWAPRGFSAPNEPRLDEAIGFLKSSDEKDELRRWWIGDVRGAKTPEWDLASTCRINGKNGLLLIEAKAHQSEMNSDHCPTKDKRNIKQINIAMSEASEKWSDLLQERAESFGLKLSHSLKLSADAHYRLNAQLAFAWKLADMGIPVVLVYLGFTEAWELLEDHCVIFKNLDQWRTCVIEKTKRLIPEELWDATYSVNGTPLTVLIRSAHVEIPE